MKNGWCRLKRSSHLLGYNSFQFVNVNSFPSSMLLCMCGERCASLPNSVPCLNYYLLYIQTYLWLPNDRYCMILTRPFLLLCNCLTTVVHFSLVWCHFYSDTLIVTERFSTLCVVYIETYLPYTNLFLKCTHSFPNGGFFHHVGLFILSIHLYLHDFSFARCFHL